MSESKTDSVTTVPVMEQRGGNKTDRGFAWIVCFASFSLNLLTDGIIFCFGLILSELVVVFQQPVAKVAWIFSILNGVSFLAGPLASVLSNRFGFRFSILLGAFLGFTGLFLSCFVRVSFEWLFLTLGLICGVAFGLVFNPAIVGIGFYFVKRRALATGIAVAGAGIGTFLFAPLTTWLLETYGLRGTFAILSAIYLNCLVFGSFFRPVESFTILNDKKAKDPLIESNGKKKKAPLRQRLSAYFKFHLFRYPSFVLVCTSSFFQSLGWFIPYMYLAAHAVQMGSSKESASFLLSIIGICNTIGRVLLGWLSDHPKVSVLLINNVSLTGCGILIILCPFFTSYGLLVVFSVLLGLGICSTSVTRPILLGDLLGRENVNNAYGWDSLFFGIANLFGVPLAGWSYDAFGDYHGAFYMAGSFVLFSAVLCYPIGWINRWEKSRMVPEIDDRQLES